MHLSKGIKAHTWAILFSIVCFLFLFWLTYGLPFATGDEVGYFRYFENGVVGMARPATHFLFWSIFQFSGMNPQAYYGVQSFAFGVFVFCVYLLALRMGQGRRWSLLAAASVASSFSVVWMFFWVGDIHSSFSLLFTIFAFLWFLYFCERMPQKKTMHCIGITILSWIAMSFKQTARFIPIMLTLFILKFWKNEKQKRSIIVLLFLQYAVLIGVSYFYRVGEGYNFGFYGWSNYIFFFGWVIRYTLPLFLITGFLMLKHSWKIPAKYPKTVFFVIIWWLVSFAASPLFPSYEERYTTSLLTASVLMLFFLIKHLSEGFNERKWIIAIIILMICFNFTYSLAKGLHRGTIYSAFDGAKSYLEEQDTGAVVFYQSGTDDLWNFHTKNKYIRPGYAVETVLSCLQKYKNTTIYFVEYPPPWLTTFYLIEEKELVTTVTQSSIIDKININIYKFVPKKKTEELWKNSELPLCEV